MGIGAMFDEREEEGMQPGEEGGRGKGFWDVEGASLAQNAGPGEHPPRRPGRQGREGETAPRK